MSVYKEYYLANSIEDALFTLAECPGSACIIAGGTDLILDIQQGRHNPVDTLVDITGIPELNSIEMRENYLFVGAGIPLNQLIQTSLVVRHAEALVEACRLIGGPQVRNAATLGGNVAHALPAGDGTISLISLDAKAQVASKSGIRNVPLVDLFEGPGKSRLDPRQDILVGFQVPQWIPGTASAFQRIMRPQGVAIAILNMSIWLHKQNEVIGDIRIVVGPAGPVPRRMENTESLLRGRMFTGDLINEAKVEILQDTQFRTSRHRATQEYRQYISGVLLEETLNIAWKRAHLNEKE